MGKGRKKGCIPWNKNLTKDTSEILKEAGNKIRDSRIGMDSPFKNPEVHQKTVESKKNIKQIEEKGILCDFGCGTEAKYQYKNGKYCCSDHYLKCKGWKSKYIEGDNSPTKRPEVKKKISDRLFEVMPEVTNRPENVERQTKLMLNGGAAIANAGNKNPSKPQRQLYEMVKILYPSAEIQYPIKELNRNLDVAIPEYKICIEYDGAYYHEVLHTGLRDLIRDIQLSFFGWRVMRYAGTLKKDILPTMEELENDIKDMIKKIEKNKEIVVLKRSH